MRTVTQFELTENHIKLLRKAFVIDTWDKFGAPAIDPKRPYGNSYMYPDIYQILTGDDRDNFFEFSDEEKKKLEQEYDNLHDETTTALQIILDTGKFEPGIYESEDFSKKYWKKVEELKDENTNVIIGIDSNDISLL